MHAGSCCSLPRACKPIPKPLPPLPPLLLHIRDGFNFCSLSRARRDHDHRKKQSILPSASEIKQITQDVHSYYYVMAMQQQQACRNAATRKFYNRNSGRKKKTESLCKIRSQHPRSKQASKQESHHLALCRDKEPGTQTPRSSCEKRCQTPPISECKFSGREGAQSQQNTRNWVARAFIRLAPFSSLSFLTFLFFPPLSFLDELVVFNIYFFFFLKFKKRVSEI
jgi:hypothetical protein